MNSEEIENQGWEEAVDAAMTHLLRTALAKTAKDDSTLSTAPLQVPCDVRVLQ